MTCTLSHLYGRIKSPTVPNKDRVPSKPSTKYLSYQFPKKSEPKTKRTVVLKEFFNDREKVRRSFLYILEKDERHELYKDTKEVWAGY